jgi:hypothetical protein
MAIYNTLTDAQKQDIANLMVDNFGNIVSVANITANNVIANSVTLTSGGNIANVNQITANTLLINKDAEFKKDVSISGNLKLDGQTKLVIGNITIPGASVNQVLTATGVDDKVEWRTFVNASAAGNVASANFTGVATHYLTGSNTWGNFASFNQNVIPSTTATYNLGNATNRFNDAYLANISS